MSDLYDRWYSARWKILTSRVGELFWQQFQHRCQQNDVSDFLADQHSFQEYINGVIENISHRLSSENNVWEHALPLLSNTEKLKDMLVADVQKQKYNTTEEYLPAFKTTLNQYLNQARRELVSIDKDYSPGKVATWERLDKINRQLLRDNNLNSRKQYTDQHAQRVADHIRKFHPKDRNLPRTSKKVLEYINEFNPPSSAEIDDSSNVIAEFDENQTKTFLPDLLPILQQCVDERLSSEQKTIVEQFFGINNSNASNVIELSKYKMNKVLEDTILDILRKCLEFKTQGCLDYEFD